MTSADSTRTGLILRPVERRMLGWVQEHMIRTVVITSLMIAAVSLAITTIALTVNGMDAFSSEWRIGLYLSTLIPLIVAPGILVYVARLLVQLDQTGRDLHAAAMIDPLTSVLNRRGFFQEVAEHPEHFEGASLLMVDLNGFKQLNDTHGHEFGDEVLIETTRWLRGQVGVDGIVGRFGGDEFVAVVPAGIGVSVGTVHSMMLCNVEVSMSIGAATVVSADSIGDALGRADDALYGAKRSLVAAA